jgi:hypothetical protein
MFALLSFRRVDDNASGFEEGEGVGFEEEDEQQATKQGKPPLDHIVVILSLIMHMSYYFHKCMF